MFLEDPTKPNDFVDSIADQIIGVDCETGVSAERKIDGKGLE